MAWDPSGLQLVTGAGLGHRFLVHRALLGSEQSLMLHDPEDRARGAAVLCVDEGPN